MKGTKKNKIVREKGITLIALVITIVILIILATVTLNAVLGEGGLIQRAQQAKELTEQAALEEQQGLNSLMSEFTNIMAEDQNPPEEKSEVEEAKESSTKFDETTKLTDDSENEVWIPGGFEIDEESATDTDEGIVITDGINEFVWIPVADYTTMYQEAPGTKLTGVETTTDVYSKLRIRSGDRYTAGLPNSTNLREPDLLSSYDMDEKYYKDILGYNSPTEMAEAFVEEYEATYNSIKKYKGFYIGRYELTGSLESSTVQKNQMVLTNQNWYNLKKACSNVVSSEYAQTTMVYGNQWDEIMSWLIATGEKTEEQVNKNSEDWGNYYDITGAATDSGNLQTSGKNEAWKSNNIYDLAGNYVEWTQEVADKRIRRGGFYWDLSVINNPASDRDNTPPYFSNYSDNRMSSRPALYIK